MPPRRQVREYTQEDWEVSPWPDPKPGQKYGPTDMQKQVFIYHMKPWERPHNHTVDIVLLIGGAGSGKCFRKGTQVLLLDGKSKKVEDIQVGDTLLGPDSKPRNVLSLGKGRETFYKVSPVKGDPFFCNESHILSLKKSGSDNETRLNPVGGTVYNKPPRYGCKNGDVVNVSVREYLTWSPRKRRAFKLYRSEAVTFPQQTSLPIDPYILGLWLGDGDSSNMTITNVDHEIVNFLEQEGFYTRDTKGKEHIKRTTNAKLNKKLKELGLINNKHIPHRYLTGSLSDRRKLLAGLIDTDGYLHSGVVEIIQKNSQLAEDILFLCRSLGMAAYNTKCIKSCPIVNGIFSGEYNRLSISGDFSKVPTILPRKQSLPRLQSKSVLVTGFSLEKLPEEDYYGFTIDGDHLFLLSDFTVVHNTLVSIATIIELAISFPLCSAVVGGKNMPLLKRNVIKEYGKRFSLKNKNGINVPWGSPIVTRAPSQHNPNIDLWNGSTISFINVDDPEVVRGFTMDVIVIEEVNLMEATTLREMFRRSRGRALPIRQFILNMNPTGSRDWIYDMFALKQFEDNYAGPKMTIGDICKCEYCHVCDANECGQWLWEGGQKKTGPNGRIYEWTDGVCSNPECANIPFTTVMKDGKVVRHGTKAKKENPCPGNQEYYRVIRSASFDNPHNPSDFIQLQRGNLSAEDYDNFIKGKIIDIRSGYIYKSFSDDNVVPGTNFDPDKDIYWTHDFNFDPMCSCVCQESDNFLDVVDEFTLWNSDELDVAKAFAKRYAGFNNTVWLYGDPNGLNTSRADSNKSSFKVMYEYLKAQGFKVQYGIRKIKGQTIIAIKDRINNLKMMIKTVDGTVRLRINPKCVNLIESLSHVQWHEKMPKEDDNVDVNARNNPHRAVKAVLMTHPQAALGYLVTKRHKFLSELMGMRVSTDGNSVVMLDEEGTVSVSAMDIQDDTPEAPPPPPMKEEFKISSMFGDGFFSGDVLRERKEHEKKLAEEYYKKRKSS